MARETLIQIRLTHDEKKALEAQAKRERLDAATWARRALLELAEQGAKHERHDFTDGSRG